jgi:hypothetical protein
LERCQPDDAIDESRREFRPIDIDLVGQNDPDRAGRFPSIAKSLPRQDGGSAPRLVVLFRRGKPEADDLPGCRCVGHNRSQLRARKAFDR